MSEMTKLATQLASMSAIIYDHDDFLTQFSYEKQDSDSVPYDQVSYVSVWASGYGDLEFVCHGPNARLLVRKLCKEFGGKWEKGASGDTFRMRQVTIDGIRISVTASRKAVCTPRVVGKETVAVPDPKAPMVTVERDVIEWDCPPSLLALTSEGA